MEERLEAKEEVFGADIIADACLDPILAKTVAHLHASSIETDAQSDVDPEEAQIDSCPPVHSAETLPKVPTFFEFLASQMEHEEPEEYSKTVPREAIMPPDTNDLTEDENNCSKMVAANSTDDTHVHIDNHDQEEEDKTGLHCDQGRILIYQ